MKSQAYDCEEILKYDTKVENDNEYNLMITNNSPLFLKSVVVTEEEEEEEDNKHKNALIDANINRGNQK
ncbi:MULTISPECIES: hypothetical protein [Paenibacillus]|uniref:hypothetical protein n=1 Tax=Paenibacillus TaxID=44249 RepID=UPI00096CD78C|nr:hypothetical protein [Paenibacillus odorifer]MEC0129731.1 hypothetical protein [Paenibacillus odorifer]MEC0224025.1 hypothetical protein [Paenibacillus odorifer]OMD02865.1 hypothetical protein BJP49_25015 [Paenibacillus odorifer]OMD10245.1 hypothetical protein BJP47_05875 [Paenibacillus odorifer]OMD22905.1 hypothetical protein BJP48_28195 [Paenibacillus odorifer]